MTTQDITVFDAGASQGPFFVLLECAKALASARRAGDMRRPEQIVEPVLIAIGRADLV